MGMSTHRESGPYQQQPWERTPMDDRWADYTKVLTELFKPLADMAGLGNSFVILPASAMPAVGVCVTETATIYLADGLFGTATPDDLTDPNYWIKHPEVFGVVLHEVLHRLFSPQDWAGWIADNAVTHGEAAAKIAIQMEEPRIEAVGIAELGPGSGYSARSFPPLTPMMIVALKYSADRLISRGAAEAVKMGVQLDTRERLSRLMILTMGRLVGGSAERHKGNNIDKTMGLIEKATTEEFRTTATNILERAVKGTHRNLGDYARQWENLMASWEEPPPPEPEDDDDIETPDCEFPMPPEQPGQQPQPGDDGDEGDDDGESQDAADESDESTESTEPQRDSGTPGGDDESEEESDDDDPEGSGAGSGDDDDDADESDDDAGSGDTSGDDDADDESSKSDEQQSQSDDEMQPPTKPLEEQVKDLFDELQQQDSDDDSSSDEEREEWQRAAEAAMQQAMDASNAELATVKRTRRTARRSAKAKWGR